MAKYATESIRTIALVGHGASGKTTLAEALLHQAGAIATQGSVERGTTVCDFDPLEKAVHHSCVSAVVHFARGDTRIHLIDTPGYPDFVGQSIGALEAVETAAIVVNAQHGIETITRRMMEWAAERDLCRMIIVNRIDADNVDLPKLLADIQEAFGKECLPINLPAEGAKKVVDCFFTPSGAADFSSVEQAHRALVEQVVEVDEQLMEIYLDKGEVSPEQLHAPFEKALREGHLIPVCFTSARNGAGVAELLDVIVKLAPNPTEGNAPHFLLGEGPDATRIAVSPDPSKHVLAHVFKVTVDPFVGRLGIFRVHQGTVTRDTQLFIGDARKAFKVSHLFMLKGKEYVEVDVAVPGDIAAIAKVEDMHFDAVLHDSHDEDHIRLEPATFPRPMHGVAIEPKKRGDEQKISEVLHKLLAEDPTFQVEHATTNETVIRGLGELHMRYLLDKMQQVYHLEVTTHPPRIPYRETIATNAEGHYRHKKQTGGAGQFGEVFLRIEPLPRGAGFEFVDAVKGGTIPGQYIPAVEKGIHQVLAAGPVCGSPMQDVRVTVYDGKHHAVDSKEVAFVTAGRKAFLEAIQKARPVVLEPVVSIDVTVPEAAMGDIAGDLSSRRGQVTGTADARAGMLTVTGKVPLSEVASYSAKLKSVTAGQGSYTIAFSHYDPVPPTVQQQLAAGHKVAAEED